MPQASPAASAKPAATLGPSAAELSGVSLSFLQKLARKYKADFDKGLRTTDVVAKIVKPVTLYQKCRCVSYCY